MLYEESLESRKYHIIDIYDPDPYPWTLLRVWLNLLSRFPSFLLSLSAGGFISLLLSEFYRGLPALTRLAAIVPEMWDNIGSNKTSERG